jgi:hypothetical protein
MKGGIISMIKRILVFTILLCFASVSVFALTMTKQDSKLVNPIEMHGIVMSPMGYAYVLGGVQTGSAGGYDCNTVDYAPIDASGNIGLVWSEAAPFPQPTNDAGNFPLASYIEFSCFEVNGYVYRIGGGSNSGNTNGDNNGDSLWGKIESNGNISSWGVMTTFPTGIGNGGLWGPGTYAVVNGNTYVYAVSGQTGQTGAYVLTPKVFMSIANPATGELTPWTEVANVPEGMYFNAAFVVGGNQLYTLGGLTTGGNIVGANNLIFRTTINPNGTLQPWTTINAPAEMSPIPYGGAVAASKHVVYLIGGRRNYGPGAWSMSTVWRATVSPSGDLSTFTAEGELQVGSTIGAIKYTPATIFAAGKQEKIYMLGVRVGIPGSTTNITSDADWETDTLGISSAVFVSPTVYTLPTAIGSGSFNPGQIKVFSVTDGTGPYTWTSSDTTAIRINTFGGSTAVVEAVGIGSATVTVSDAYSDTDSIAASVIATSAPLFKDIESKKYIRFELFN